MSTTPTLYTKAALPRDPSRRSTAVFIGGNLALDFVNSTEAHSTPGALDHLMPGFSNLLDWAEQAGLVAADEARRMLLVAGRNPREAAAIRARAVALREALHAIVHALLEQTLPNAAPLQTLQAEITLARAAQQLVATGNGLGWDWTNPTALDRIVAEVSLAADVFFTGTQVAALRHCAAPDCERVFLDTSRNGRRRYCTSDGCGTRERVRQFRQRQRVSNDTSSQEQP